MLRPMRIPFFYDYACPWAFFGSCRVEDYFADLDVEIAFTPVYLKALAEPSPQAGKLAPMGPRKRSHYMADLLRWAEFAGVRLHPGVRDIVDTDTRPALRVALVAAERSRFREFHHPAYRARWCEARDLSQPEVLAELVAKAGLDPDDVLAEAASPEVEERLEKQTRRAIDLGVFGVPTLALGEDIYWGNDRFELARFRLASGVRSDRS